MKCSSSQNFYLLNNPSLSRREYTHMNLQPPPFLLKLTFQGHMKTSLTPTIWLWEIKVRFLCSCAWCVCCSILPQSRGERKTRAYRNIAVLCPPDEAERKTQEGEWPQAIPLIFSHNISATGSWTWELGQLWSPTLWASVYPMPSTNTAFKYRDNFFLLLLQGHLSSKADSENCFLEMKVLVVINNLS